MQLRRIGVGSAAKVAGALYAVLGLIAGLIIALISMVSAGLLAGAQTEEVPSWLGPIFGIGAVVFFPILYGVLGVILGAVVAAVYNAVAGMVGGIELDLEDSRPALTPSR